MDDKKIRALLTVVKTGSLNKAAEQIGYTQPGLTQMMNSLEKEAGCQLLLRSNKGITLTPEGARLLPFLQHANDALERLEAEIQQLHSGMQQPLRIGGYASISRTWLPELLRNFRRLYPDLPVEITVGGRDLAGKVHDGVLDLAFVDAQLAPGFSWFPIHDAMLTAIVPPDYPHTGPITLPQLLKEPFLTAPDQYICARLSEWNDQIHQLQIDAADDASIISMVETGLGVSVLSTLSLQGYAHRVHTLPLDPPLHCTLGIICKTTRAASSPIREFIQMAQQTAEQLSSPPV